MVTRRWLAGLVVAVLAAVAYAGADANEMRWIRQCVDGLSTNNDRVRASAESALGALGVEVIPTIVPLTTKLKDDADWESLARALAAMGTKVAADEVRDEKPRWPKGLEARFSALVSQLEKGAVPAAPGKPPANGGAAPQGVDPAVDAKVRALLEPFRDVSTYSSEDARVHQVVALGRAAIPSLLQLYREMPDMATRMLSHAVGDALSRLVEERDVPALSQLLLDGHLAATAAFGRLRCAAARDALLDTVRRGFVNYELLEALDAWSTDRATRETLLAWLENHVGAGDWDAGAVAEHLAEWRVDEAMPLLEPVIAGYLEPSVRVMIAGALVDLGGVAGIPVLIDILATPPSLPSDDYARDKAGDLLNRIAGQRFYSGRYGGPARQATGNFDEAAAKFRAWWESVEDRIRFDRTRRAWVVD